MNHDHGVSSLQSLTVIGKRVSAESSLLIKNDEEEISNI